MAASGVAVTACATGSSSMMMWRSPVTGSELPKAQSRIVSIVICRPVW